MLSFEWNFLGLSSETKPVAGEKVIDGSTFYECDTGNFYIFYDGTWYKQTFITEDGINVYVYKYLMRKMFKRSFDSNITKTHIYRPDVGSNISFTSEYPASITDMQVYGDTFQQTYSGKNLLGLQDVAETTALGVNYSVADGILTINGTTTSSGGIVIPLKETITLDSALNYVLSGTQTGSYGSGYIEIDLRDTTNTSNVFPTRNTYLPATIDNTDGVVGYFGIYTASGRTFDNYTIRPQLEAGSAPTAYEPFVGGTASPNPSYPQDVQVVTGEQTIKMRGKNLLDVPDGTTTIRGLTFTRSENTIVCSGIRQSTGNNWFVMTGDWVILDTPFPVATYTFSIGEPTTKDIEFSMKYSDGSITSYTIRSGRTSVTFTTTLEIAQYRLVAVPFSANEPASGVAYKDIQLETGSRATDFEKPPKSYIVNLGSTELCKIGDYQDYIYKSGDDWYVHKETAKIVLAGGSDETWDRTTIGSGDYRFYVNVPGVQTTSDASKVGLVISNKLLEITNAAQFAGTQGIRVRSNGNEQLILYTDATATMDVTSFKTWLASNNITAYYALATATNTKITDNTLIAQLEDILTYEFPTGTNNIIVTASDLPALLKLTITERD